MFEHIDEPLGALKEAAAKLRSGGLLRIAVPDATDALERLRASKSKPIDVLQPFQHINGFTHKALVRLCNEAGFELIPGRIISRKLLQQIRATRNLDYFQESLKNLWTQARSTTLYFQKR